MKSPLDLPASEGVTDTKNPNNKTTISFNGGATATNSLNATLSISAKKYTEMYITFTDGCASGGQWETITATKAVTLQTANATNTIYAKFRFTKNSEITESTCVSTSILHDTSTPTVAITSPANGAPMNAVLDNVFVLVGTCSKDGTVYITSPIVTAATCLSGSWTRVLDLSSQADGNVTIKFNLKSNAGNQSANYQNTYIKDSTPPSAASILIEGGATTTQLTTVTLTLAATDAVEMYITNTADCAADGTWEVYAPTKSWDLVNALADNTIYVKYRDLFQNETSCVSATITQIP